MPLNTSEYLSVSLWVVLLRKVTDVERAAEAMGAAWAAGLITSIAMTISSAPANRRKVRTIRCIAVLFLLAPPTAALTVSTHLRLVVGSDRCITPQTHDAGNTYSRYKNRDNRGLRHSGAGIWCRWQHIPLSDGILVGALQ